MAVDFAAMLVELRHAAELTQEQAAEYCGLEVRTMRNLETGRHLPRRSTVDLIVTGLALDDVDADQLRTTIAARTDRSTGSRIPCQLPSGARPFSGREGELRTLDTLTAGPGALVVICGAAGVGKTALAVRWARQHAGVFAHGQLFVDLRGYGSGLPVQPTESLAQLLVQTGVRPPASTVEDLAAAWRSATDDRQVLLVLDNATSAEQIRPLLPANPDCCVLVTSRDALAGLVACDGAVRLELDVLPSNDSIGLLRAVIGVPAREDPAGVRRLASACGHLPLALRIAAEQATARPDIGLSDLAERLERDPLRELDPPGDPHNAVRAVLMSSYRALPETAAQALQLLGVLPRSTFDLDAATHLFGSASESARHRLDQLVRAHMITALGSGRYAMHDLLYAFARQLSAQDPAAGAAAFARLVDHLLSAARNAAEAGDTESLTDQREVLVATAVQAGHFGHDKAVVDIADILAAPLEAIGAHHEMVVLLEAATVAMERLGRADRVGEALRLLAVAHYRLGRPEAAIGAAFRALAAFRAVSDRQGEARCLMNIGSVRWRSGFGEDALVWYRRALATYQADGDRLGAAGALCNIGNIHSGRGRTEAALGCYTDALTTYEQLGERRSESITLVNLGGVYLKLGQLDRAWRAEARAAALAHQVSSRTNEGIALGNLGEISLLQGRDRQARRYFLMALRLARDVGDRVGEGLALDNLGVVHHRRGDLHKAERLIRQSLNLARETRNRDGENAASIHLAEVALDLHRVETAQRLATDAVCLAAATDTPARAAQALTVLAAAGERTGDESGALAHRRRALACARRSGDVSEVASALHGLAAHRGRFGSQKLAERHHRYAADLLTGIALQRFGFDEGPADETLAAMNVRRLAAIDTWETKGFR